MRTYPDETLAFYADRFVLLRLARHGVTLEQYLANVARFERLALENEPLLPAQHGPVLRLWAEADTGLKQASTPPLPPHWSDATFQDYRELFAQAEREIGHLPRRTGASNFSKRGA